MWVSLVGNTLHITTRWCAKMCDTFLRGMEASCLKLSQMSCYMLLLLADSDLFPFAIKNVIINIVLSWVLWIIAENYRSWRGSPNHWISSQLPRSEAGQGLVSEVRAVLWGLCPSPVRSGLTPVSWCQKSLQKLTCVSFVKMQLRMFS